MNESSNAPRRYPKSPVAAGILSGIFPGAGQMYNGQFAKGVLFLIVFAGMISMMPHGPHPFLPLVFAGFYIFQIIEAIQQSNLINRQMGGGSEAVPSPAAGDSPASPPAAPASQGSVFWGLLLIGLGLVFLLTNFEIVNIERIWDFWPVVVIIVGLKMIFDFARKKD